MMVKCGYREADDVFSVYYTLKEEHDFQYYLNKLLKVFPDDFLILKRDNYNFVEPILKNSMKINDYYKKNKEEIIKNQVMGFFIGIKIKNEVIKLLGLMIQSVGKENLFSISVYNDVFIFRDLPSEVFKQINSILNTFEKDSKKNGKDFIEMNKNNEVSILNKLGLVTAEGFHKNWYENIKYKHDFKKIDLLNEKILIDEIKELEKNDTSKLTCIVRDLYPNKINITEKELYEIGYKIFQKDNTYLIVHDDSKNTLKGYSGLLSKKYLTLKDVNGKKFMLKSIREYDSIENKKDIIKETIIDAKNDGFKEFVLYIFSYAGKEDKNNFRLINSINKKMKVEYLSSKNSRILGAFKLSKY